MKRRGERRSSALALLLLLVQLSKSGSAEAVSGPGGDQAESCSVQFGDRPVCAPASGLTFASACVARRQGFTQDVLQDGPCSGEVLLRPSHPYAQGAAAPEHQLSQEESQQTPSPDSHEGWTYLGHLPQLEAQQRAGAPAPAGAGSSIWERWLPAGWARSGTSSSAAAGLPEDRRAARPGSSAWQEAAEGARREARRQVLAGAAAPPKTLLRFTREGHVYAQPLPPAAPTAARPWPPAGGGGPQRGGDGSNGTTPGRRRRRLGIFGQDHRIPCPRFPTFPFSAVGHVQLVQNGDSFGCSGALVGPSSVLTAAHCVYSRKLTAFHDNIRFSPAAFVSPSSDGMVRPFDSFGWTSIDVISDYVNALYLDPNESDLALITLQEGAARVGLQTGWLGIAQACSGRWDEPFRATTAGYPTDLDQGSCITAQCVIQQHDCYAAVLRHRCDTLPGQSGSAMWQGQVGPDGSLTAYVRAVHNVEWFLSNNTVYVNSGVAITPDHQEALFRWLAADFRRLSNASSGSGLSVPPAAAALQPGDPFVGAGMAESFYRGIIDEL